MDIVERMRVDNEGCGTRMDEAADEIESLRQQLAELQARNFADGWRQCAKGQCTTQYCGLTEEAIRQAKRDALLEAAEKFKDESDREAINSVRRIAFLNCAGWMRRMADEQYPN